MLQDYRIFIAVSLFRIHLLSRDDIYSLYWGKFYVLGLILDCVRYNAGGFRFIEVSGLLYRGSVRSIHFTVTLAGLKNIVRYTEDFVMRFVKSRFYCISTNVRNADTKPQPSNFSTATVESRFLDRRFLKPASRFLEPVFVSLGGSRNRDSYDSCLVPKKDGLSWLTGTKHEEVFSDKARHASF